MDIDVFGEEDAKPEVSEPIEECSRRAAVLPSSSNNQIMIRKCAKECRDIRRIVFSISIDQYDRVKLAACVRYACPYGHALALIAWMLDDHAEFLCEACSSITASIIDDDNLVNVFAGSLDHFLYPSFFIICRNDCHSAHTPTE